MSCYNPLIGVPFPSDHPRAGQLCICGSVRKGTFSPPTFPNVDRETGVHRITGEVLLPIRVGCGKCVGCLLDRSRDWASRIFSESLLYDSDSCWFVTLTYRNPKDGVYLPRFNCSRNELDVLILDKKHPTDFFKRVRESYKREFGFPIGNGVSFVNFDGKEHELGLRYFLAGEYGDVSLRPHYHVIMMNIAFPDLKFIGHTEKGFELYNSDFLTRKWGFGHAVLARLSVANAAYVARYTLKKAEEAYNCYWDDLHMVKPYTVMSRNPGIGLPFLVDHLSIYDHDELILPTQNKDKPNCFRPPKYFDSKLKDLNPKLMAQIKANRSAAAELVSALRLECTDLSEADFLENAERSKKEAIKSLVRAI